MAATVTSALRETELVRTKGVVWGTKALAVAAAMRKMVAVNFMVAMNRWT